jgi:soluble lytic murein transglycosylase-like protein
VRWVAQATAELRAKNVRRFDRLTREAARRHAVPLDLIRAVILVESGYNARALSPAGAQGLMQLMPATAEALRVTRAFDARQNVLGGAHLLRMLGNRFDDPVLAIAAYNAGPDAVIKYGGVPPYRETRRYVERVLGAYQHYRVRRLRALHK